MLPAGFLSNTCLSTAALYLQKESLLRDDQTPKGGEERITVDTLKKLPLSDRYAVVKFVFFKLNTPHDSRTNPSNKLENKITEIKKELTDALQKMIDKRKSFLKKIQILINNDINKENANAALALPEFNDPLTDNINLENLLSLSKEFNTEYNEKVLPFIEQIEKYNKNFPLIETEMSDLSKQNDGTEQKIIDLQQEITNNTELLENLKAEDLTIKNEIGKVIPEFTQLMKEIEHLKKLNEECTKFLQN